MNVEGLRLRPGYLKTISILTPSQNKRPRYPSMQRRCNSIPNSIKSSVVDVVSRVKHDVYLQKSLNG